MSEPTKRPAAPTEESDPSERPTVNPPFDVEAFARAASAPSIKPLTTPDLSSNPPLPPTGVPDFGSEPPSQRITLTNEVELERARAQSVPHVAPHRTITSGALSIANARVPSVPKLEVHVPAGTPERSDGRRAIIPPRAPSSASTIEAAVLDAVDRSPSPEITERTIEDPVAEMRERYSLGDYSGALEVAELILAEDPEDPEAAQCSRHCRLVLENMYAARLGPLDRVPAVVVASAQMRWLSMDHRAGFVLSLIDGSSSIEMILDLCGMPKLDALKILLDLVQQKIVALR